MRALFPALLPCFLLLCNPLFSQWQRTGGPSGGFVLDLAANSQYLFAGTTNGVFRSADEGQSWQRLENGLPVSFHCYQVKIKNEQLILRGYDYMEDYITGEDIYKSANNGEDWFEIPLPDTVKFPDEIAIYGDFIFVADDAVLRSEDDGQTWTGYLSQTDTFFSANFMEVFEEKLYVLEDQRLWTTTDWGATWEKIHLPAGAGDSDAIYPKDSLLVLACETKAYRSTNDGASWQLATGWVSTNPAWKDIVLVNGVFYVNSKYILRSANGGLTWVSVSGSSSSPYFVGLAAGNGALYACDNAKGVCKYSISEESFAESDFGIDATSISSLSVHGNDLWAGVSFDGLYRYDVVQEKWDTANYFQVPYELLDIAWGGDSLFVIDSYGEVFRSGNGGQTWTNVSPGDWTDAFKFARHGNTLYLLAGYGVGFQSDDFGETWQPALPGFYAQLQESAIGFSPHGPFLFVNTFHEVYRSSDGGVHWEEKGEGIDLQDGFVERIYSAGDALILSAVEFDSSFLYKLTFFVSFDHGENWYVASEGLPTYIIFPGEEEIIPSVVAFQDTIVLGLPGRGPYFMKGNTLEWHPLKVDGRFPHGTSDLALTQNKLFTGTRGMGVWQMNASGPPDGIFPVIENACPLKIFPNPANTNLIVMPETGGPGKGFLFVFTPKGELVFLEKVLPGVSVNIAISQWPAGEYFVRLEADSRVFAGKFMKLGD